MRPLCFPPWDAKVHTNSEMERPLKWQFEFA